MTETHDLRSLDLCAIGLGQGGGNLAAEWRRRGYRSLLLNTARADVRALSHHEGLDVPEKLVVDIGLEGTEGAGKDPEYGMACVKAHAEDIRAGVEKHLRGADALLLCAGLGGGTGSALPELVRTLAPLDIPVITVTSLPSSAESGISKVNAVKTVNALVGQDLAGRLFIDNDRLQGTFPDLDMVSYFPAVNTKVLAPLDELNRLNRRDDLWSIRTFDGEDLRKVLLSGGVLQTHVAKLDKDGALDASYLIDVVTQCVDGGDHLARGLDIAKTAYLALVVVGPEKALRATAMHVFDDAVRELKHRTGGGAVYEGLYVAPEDAPLRAFVLSASLSLPERVGTLLDDARAEGNELAKKIQAEITPLEITPLEGLSLFRSPSRKTATQRPQAPEPRPLGEQVAQQVQELTRPRATASLSDATKTPPKDAVTGGPSLEEEPARSEPSDAYRPRVGTGRYDDEEALETTRVAQEAEAAAIIERAPPAPPAPAAAAEEASRGDATPRVGSGQRDADPLAEAPEPTLYVADDDVLRRETRSYDASSAAIAATPVATGRVALVDPASVVSARPVGELADGLSPPLAGAVSSPLAPAPVTLKKPTPIRPQTNRAALLPDDAKVDYDLDHDDFRDGPMTDPQARAPFLHRPVSDDSSDEGLRTRTDARPTWMEDASVALSSVLQTSGTELQSVYEDLVERFRQAADKRDKERVARRLVDDCQADDVEVRALAVWAMVKLGDPAFRRALGKCQSDGNPEIARMAKAGAAKLVG